MASQISADYSQIRFPRAHPDPVGSGYIKQSPEDFFVDETLSFSFTGEGEHSYLKIRKTGQNTMWVVGVLARHFNVKERDIGFAGLKDRQAVTTQWFSLLARSITPEKIQSFNEDGVEILDVQRHSGKLRKGAIKYNHFRIIVRELKAAKIDVEKRLHDIASGGVPNYFDEQRFGKERQNLIAASKLFSGELRPQNYRRRLYLSAARSWLFNHVLAERVKQGYWSSGLDGDVFILDGSRKFFHEEKLTDELVQRLADHDIHPTGPLWGRGELPTSSVAKDLELQVLADWRSWCEKLEQAGMKQQRRATRIIPVKLQFKYDEVSKILELTFNLPAGAYATNILRELVDVKESINSIT